LAKYEGNVSPCIPATMPTFMPSWRPSTLANFSLAQTENEPLLVQSASFIVRHCPPPHLALRGTPIRNTWLCQYTSRAVRCIIAHIKRSRAVKDVMFLIVGLMLSMEQM
jgi:hypothetical protein